MFIASLIYAGTALLGKRHLHPRLYAQMEDTSCRVDMDLQLLSKGRFVQIFFLCGDKRGPRRGS